MCPWHCNLNGIVKIQTDNNPNTNECIKRFLAAAKSGAMPDSVAVEPAAG
jgi:hypothetical protein